MHNPLVIMESPYDIFSNCQILTTMKVHILAGTYNVLCTIWYYLHNVKNVKKQPRGVLLLVKLSVTV